VTFLTVELAARTKQDSPTLEVLDDSRALNLHIGSVVRQDADAILGIRGKTAVRRRRHRSGYRMSVQA